MLRCICELCCTMDSPCCLYCMFLYCMGIKVYKHMVLSQQGCSGQPTAPATTSLGSRADLPAEGLGNHPERGGIGPAPPPHLLLVCGLRQDASLPLPCPLSGCRRNTDTTAPRRGAEHLERCLAYRKPQLRGAPCPLKLLCIGSRSPQHRPPSDGETRQDEIKQIAQGHSRGGGCKQGIESQGKPPG